MGSRWALPHLLLYCELVRLPYRRTSSFASSARWKLPWERYGSPKFRCESSNDPPWPTTPACRCHARRYRVERCWLQSGKPPGPMQQDIFRGSTPSLTLWLTILLSLSSAYLVTSICIRFRSGPVANLWPGWIVQLTHNSLSWHTLQNVSTRIHLVENRRAANPPVKHKRMRVERFMGPNIVLVEQRPCGPAGRSGVALPSFNPMAGGISLQGQRGTRYSLSIPAKKRFALELPRRMAAYLYIGTLALLPGEGDMGMSV